MKSGLTLTQLALELERRASAKQDIVADTRKLHIANDGQLVVEGTTPGAVVGMFPINDIAHNQIAQRLEIPAKYYNRMLREAPGLHAANVNHWLENNPEQRLVRTLDGRARAFLSDRYQRIENEQIANVVLPILLDEPEVRIESCQITESRLYIKAVFPRIAGEVKKGDVVQSGVVISNSEVGQGAVRIEPMIFRLVCLNGAIINDARFMARHVGGRIGSEDSNIAEILSDEALKADDHAILLKTRDVVRASFDQVRFNRHVEALQISTGDLITGNPVETVKMLAKKASLNEFEEGSVLRELIKGGDISRYGLLNAVTATAQAEILSYDRATELEALGGNILTLDRKEWNTMAAAA